MRQGGVHHCSACLEVIVAKPFELCINSLPISSKHDAQQVYSLAFFTDTMHVKQISTYWQHALLICTASFLHEPTVASVLHVNQACGHASSSCFCRGHTEKAMANWLTAVGFWEGQALRRIFTAWRAQGGQKVLKALAHWESSQSGTGPAFRWWRRVVQHLREADQQAQQHRQQHACRAAFQARMRTPCVACCPAFLHAIPSPAGSHPSTLLAFNLVFFAHRLCHFALAPSGHV